MSNTSTSTTAEPETAWQRMTTNDRTAFLAPLIGTRIEWIVEAERTEGRKVFGEAFPDPWHMGTLEGFAANRGPIKPVPGIRVRTPGVLGDQFAVLEYAILYDVRPAAAGAADVDFDGADVFAADEVACPHCGHKLRVTQRATVGRVEDNADEGSADA